MVFKKNKQDISNDSLYLMKSNFVYAINDQKLDTRNSYQNNKLKIQILYNVMTYLKQKGTRRRIYKPQ